MPKRLSRKLKKLLQEREYAKECLVLSACCHIEGLHSADLEKYVNLYQEANKKFEEAMGGHYQ